jgi:hypothetical protein
MKEKNKNRPDTHDARPKGVLFSTEGSSGWHHRRELGTYKEDRGWSEHDFSHLHDKFADPGSDDPVE